MPVPTLCRSTHQSDMVLPPWGRFSGGGANRLPSGWQRVSGIGVRHSERLAGRPSAGTKLWANNETTYNAAIEEYFSLLAPLLPPRDAEEARALTASELEMVSDMFAHRTELVIYGSNWPTGTAFPNVSHLALAVFEDYYPGATFGALFGANLDGTRHAGGHGPAAVLNKTVDIWEDLPAVWDAFDVRGPSRTDAPSSLPPYRAYQIYMHMPSSPVRPRPPLLRRHARPPWHG